MLTSPFAAPFKATGPDLSIHSTTAKGMAWRVRARRRPQLPNLRTHPRGALVHWHVADLTGPAFRHDGGHRQADYNCALTVAQSPGVQLSGAGPYAHRAGNGLHGARPFCPPRRWWALPDSRIRVGPVLAHGLLDEARANDGCTYRMPRPMTVVAGQRPKHQAWSGANVLPTMMAVALPFPVAAVTSPSGLERSRDLRPCVNAYQGDVPWPIWCLQSS